MSAISSTAARSTSSHLVTLRDGSQIDKGVLHTTFKNINDVSKKNFNALVELVEKCKDDNYQFLKPPYGNSEAVLLQYHFIEQGSPHIHELIKRVVLNSVEEEMEHIRLRVVNPLYSKIVSKL